MSDEQEIVILAENGDPYPPSDAPGKPIAWPSWALMIISLATFGVGLAMRWAHDKPPAPESAFKMVSMSSVMITVDDDFPDEYRPAPADHPPSTLTVDGDQIVIKYVRRSWLLRRHALARTYVTAIPIVVLLPEDSDGREIREFLLHELMHVALRESGGTNNPLYGEGDGEDVINPSARILVDILRDNPKLVLWMQKK